MRHTLIFICFFLTGLLAFGQTVPPPNIEGVITDVDPTSATIPESLLVNISGSGTHFAQGTGTTVWFTQGSSTIYASDVNELTDELVSVQMLFKYNHQPGSYTVNTFNNYDGHLTLENGFFLNPNPSPPYIVSCSPSNGQAGTLLIATVTGQFTHFTEGYTYLYLKKTGGWENIYSEEISITSDEVMIVEFSLTSGFEPGYYNLYVFNSWDGTMHLNNAFYLSPDPDPPYLSSITPEQGTIPETLTVTLSGVNTHFNQGTGTSLWFKQGSYTTITPDNISPLSDTELNATFSFSNSDDPGVYDVKTFSGIDGTLYLENAFYLNPNPNPPHLVSIVPGSSQPGSSLSVTISGENTNFTQGTSTSVWFNQGNSTIYATSVVEFSDELLDADFYISNSAALGYYNVNTYNQEDGELSLMEAFYIGAPSPELTQIIPNSGYLNDIISMQVFGDETHFADATNLSAWLSNAGENIYPFNLNAPNNTELALDIAIPEDAEPGFWTMNVANGIDGLLSLPEAFELIDTISSVHPGDQELFINVYPNPNHGIFYVSAKLLKSAKFELQVSDIMGKQVAAFDYGNLLIYRGRVDLSFLPAGIYNLQFLIDGNIENRKIVID